MSSTKRELAGIGPAVTPPVGRRGDEQPDADPKSVIPRARRQYPSSRRRAEKLDTRTRPDRHARGNAGDRELGTESSYSRARANDTNPNKAIIGQQAEPRLERREAPSSFC